MTTTAMKRAGQLIAHLDTLHQIRDVRQLLLLQLSMRERQDQVALFRRQDGAVTLSLIGVQPSSPTEELGHRAGTASAAALLNQLQDVSGVRGDDVAFSSGQIADVIAAQTGRIEASEGLAKLDAALLNLVGRLEQELGQQVAEAHPLPSPEALTVTETEAASAETGSVMRVSEADEVAPERSTDEGDTDEISSADADSGVPTGRVSRRRSA